MLSPLLFLVYTGNLPEEMRFNPKLFADDTSLFATMTVISSSNLNQDLLKITQLNNHWKILFNQDIIKQAREFVYQEKNDLGNPTLYFNDARIQRQFVRKHLGLFLDEKFSFLEYIEVKIKKATVGVNLMCKLNLYYHVRHW